QMDGDTALKFVRSRHGNNGEGSDFARAARQQKVILAAKEKLLSGRTLTNPQRLIKLYESIATNIQTDLTPWEIIKLAPMAGDISSENITTRVLTNDPDGELVNGNVGGAYMLFPRERDWSEIRVIAQHPFATKEEAKAQEEPQEDTAVEIRNGTNITGYASRMSQYLEDEGYIVQGIGNALQKGYEKTVIYDLTKGQRDTELAALRSMLDANVAPIPAGWTQNNGTADEQKPTDPEHTDFLIVLGDSSYGLVE
ncbi:hypothetical protein GF380_01285, partial [Candidatus Uhrbacteria bacterium]|nr:hypothetical protein [Candidatus Uhrbacteria bacterium]MBD3283918.1 hypothetical protein [Candidatus Uhrbacteria bacterium]